MAWPANITTKTVTATFYDMQTELPASGNVTFTPSPPNGVWFLDPAASTVVVPTPTVAQMDANGAISVVLPCTDDIDMSPINWTWHCKMVSSTGQVAEFDFSLPTASVSPVDLSSIINVPIPAAPAGLYAKSVNGVTPDVNGNITLFTIAPTILGNMADVNAPTPANLNILSWDTATGKWIKSGRLTTVEAALGTWSGGTAISRIQALEAPTTWIGGESQSTSAQPLGAGATKLSLGGSPAWNGITFNGTDTWTVQSTGQYVFDLQLRTAAAVAGSPAIGSTTYADSTLFIPPRTTAAGNWGDTGTSGAMHMVAGTQFCAYFYNAGAATSIAHATRPAKIRVWKIGR